MKSIVSFIFAILLTVATVIAAAPPAVEAAFAKKFPAITNATWVKDANGNYEARFRAAEKDISATFAENGEWLATATEILVAALPPSVLASFQKKTNKKHLPKAATKIESNDKPVYYELKYHHIGIRNREILYNKRGKEVKE